MEAIICLFVCVFAHCLFVYLFVYLCVCSFVCLLLFKGGSLIERRVASYRNFLKKMKKKKYPILPLNRPTCIQS